MSRINRIASRWIAACVPVLLLAWSATALQAQSAPQRVLGRDEILLYGIGLKVEPGYQTVPKDIATIVGTFLQAPSLPSGVSPFAAGAEVVATLRGPSFQAPVELRVRPNTPFNIPALTVPGPHVLENIRLVSGGEVLLRGTPDHVTIDVIEKLLVTQVSARALTAAEIREKGIVFDASNFQAYNFSAAFAIGDQPVNLNFPIVLPRLDGAADVTPGTTMLGTIPAASLPTLSTIIPDTLKLQAQIPNLSVVGFTLKLPSLNGQKFVVPPIPGVVVIPGDIGFLNQYFSVMLLVGNVAPGGSNLVVTNLKAEIVLPPGNDRVANSGDDPLRMAQTAQGESPRVQLVAQPGPDGKVGTADDVPSIGPGQSGNAEYLVEGRREGSHVVEMQITGTLEGLPIGPVTVTGRAAGAVLVRNPKFTLTFAHPQVVSAGEPYTLDVTVTNTSTAPANFVSINLYPRNVTGATIVGDPSRGIDSLVPGDSATVTFNLIAKKAGSVTAATLDSDENVAGRFSLKAAVGELGVPLSPDSLVLPKEANGLRLPGDNPDDLKQAALGLLGKAHAVATAPAAALPADVRRFSRKVVIDRAIQVAEAGLRVTMQEPLPVSASQLFMDFMGSDVSRLASLFPNPADQDFERNNIEGFDELRRRSIRGDQFAAAAGRAMAPNLTTQGGEAFLNGLAQSWSYRPNHVSVLVTGNGQPLPARFSLVDAQGRRVGDAGADGKIVKEIPFSDVVDFTNASGLVVARLIVLAAPQPGNYQVKAAPGAGAPINAGYLVSIVAPDAAGALRQATTSALTFPQRPAAMGSPGDPYVFTFGEFGGDTIPGANVTQVVDPGPTVVSVIQQAQADVLKCEEEPGVPIGRIVAVLFSEEVTPESVQDRLGAADIAAFGVDGNRVVGVALQPGRRIAFLALRDPFGPFVARQITISSVRDMRGNVMSPWTGAMQATVPDDGA
ncbi:MAG TPA: CARDB domain-containing protein, partial [Vicinamibacterales bacterium]|nr:CARDB domain-containing protein [Vicinamibacterales bacterium]